MFIQPQGNPSTRAGPRCQSDNSVIASLSTSSFWWKSTNVSAKNNGETTMFRHGILTDHL
jgi:hypothetical protein